MSVCPWCKAQNPPGADLCLRCGKKPGDHPSIAGREMPGAFEDEEGAGGPALHLELGGAGGAPARGGVQAESGGGALKSFGDGWDDEESAGTGAALDLDLGTDLPHSSRRGAAASPLPPPTRGGSGSMRAVDPGPPLVIPKSGGVAQQAIEIDPYEIKVLADYGAEPTSIGATVPYAIRVKRRQRELRRALASVRAALVEAEGRRDERLTELGALLRPVVEGNSEYAAFAGPLASAEKSKQSREAALMDANSAFKDRAATIDAQIAEQQPPLEAAKKEEGARVREHEAADLLRQKHEARRKRVEIDVRNAQAKLGHGDTTAPDKAAAQALIAAAASERETRLAEERIAIKQAQEVEARAATARRGVAQVEEKIAALRKQRAELEKEFARQGAVRTEGIDAASREVKNALLEIGKRSASGGPNAEGADLRRKAIVDAEAQVRRVQLDLEKHLRALGSADEPSVKKGLIILFAVIFVLVSAFVAWRVMRTNPYLEDANKKTSCVELDFARSSSG